MKENRKFWGWASDETTEREMSTPLFLLQCVQLGIGIRDLELLSIGLVNDMWVESINDGCEYAEVAGQERFDLW